MVRALVHAATTVFLAIFCVFVFGWSSYQGLPRESAPDIDIPVVVVSTPYIGVSPEDIEGLVTIPIENELASLTDVKRMNSSSAEGVSIVSIEFEPEVNISDALQKVRDRVQKAKPKLPADAEEPSVSEISFSDIPILLVTLAGGVDEQQLKRLAEDLEDDVGRIPGVLEADVTGGRKRQIQVLVYPERLAAYGLSLDDVSNAISGENVNIPGGNLTVGSGTFLLRTPGEFDHPRQLESVAVKRVGDIPVFLTDVARVVDDFEDRTTYSRMGGEPSVTLSVKKRSGANILAVADAVKALVEDRSQTWPAGVTFQVLGDQSRDIEQMVAELQNNIITALLLVVGVIFLFMGVRNSMFVAVSIPLSMFMAFLVIGVVGFTLNMVVLFSLILALGMLVDNAIVVVENIYRHVEMGKAPMVAAVDGTNEVAIAVAASTATTVAAFLPLAFWTGIMGQFMGYLPKTVIIVLVSSLVVAVMALPVLASRLMPAKPVGGSLSPVSAVDDTDDADGGTEDGASAVSGDVDDEAQPIDVTRLPTLLRRYVGLLEFSIDRRYLSLLMGVGVLVGTVVIYSFLHHGVAFFPSPDPERATIGVRLPEGADLDATDRVVRVVESVLARTENVDTYVVEVGVAGGGNALAGSSESANNARITVDFRPSNDKAGPDDLPRVENTNLTLFKLRRMLARVPGAAITVEPEDFGPPVGAPVAVEVSGDDFHQLGAAAAALVREMEKIEGTTDLDSDYLVGRPEVRLRIDRGAAKRVGVSTQAIGGAVRTAIAGSKASAWRDGEDEHDIVVRLAPEYRRDLQQVLTLRLPGREDTSPNTFPVPLSAVASYELAGGAGTIKHVDQTRVVTITGDVTRPELENEVRAKVSELLASWDAPEGVYARVAGAQDEQDEAAAFLGWAFSIAVALILLVLVAQFDSLAMPVIILATVIMSLAGVLWGLILTGTPFGIIMTGIGIISLAGVVVNNAIVLLDYVQQLQARGLELRDALVRAGVTRFRPVMLTAITTTLGLIPMAIGVSVDFTNLRVVVGSTSAQFWGPMAVAVIFGLSFATVLTLVMVPTMYSIYGDLLGLVSRRGARRATKAVVALVPLALLFGASPAQAVTLDEAYAAAESHNVDLALIREQTAQAQTFRWQALSAVMPRLSFNATYNINQNEFRLDFADEFGDLFSSPDLDPAALAPLVTHPDSPFTPRFLQEAFAPALESLFAPQDLPAGDPIIIQPKQAWSGNLTLFQPILNGQAIPFWIGANRQADAAKEDERRIRQQVRGAVAQSYYGLATARESVRVSEAAVDMAQHQLALAERRVASGAAERRVQLQARLGLSQAERDLMGAMEQLGAAEESFHRITGLPRDADVQMPEGSIAVPESLAVAQATASLERPDVQAAMLRQDAARLERVGRDLEWMPTIDFTFTQIYQQVPGFIPQRFQWQIGFNFGWQIFDGGLRIARSRELASRTRQAALQVKQRRQNAEEQVRVAWERLHRAERALTAVMDEVALAEENLQLTEFSLDAGSATWLDVENARLNLDAARLNVARERMSREVSAVELLVAMGAFTR